VVSVLFTYEDVSRGLVVSSPHPERLIEVSPWSISPSVADLVMSWTMRIFLVAFLLFILYAVYQALTSKGDGLPIPLF